MSKYAVLLVVLGSVLWGTDSLFRRPLTQDFSPITIVYLEHCVLSVVVLPFVLRARQPISKLQLKDWACLAFIAWGGSVTATSLFTYSIKYGNPSVTVLLQKTQPLFTILLARWFLGERPRKWFWPLLIPALCGAYLVSTPDWRAGFSVSPRQPLSLIAAVGAAGFWGSSTVFGRYIVGKLPVVVLTGLRFIIALPMLAALFWLQEPMQRLLPTTFPAVASVGAMALIPGLAGLVLYYKGLRSTIASLASIAELAFPVTAVAANWVFLNIHLTTSQFFGGFLLVSSVTVLTYLNATDRSQIERDSE